MKSESNLDRNAQFRSILVNTAQIAPYLRPRPSIRTVVTGVVVSVVAFAAAGAIAGGAVAAASAPDAQEREVDAAVQIGGQSWAAEEDAQLLGKPFLASGTGTVTIGLGVKPPRANALVEGSVCTDPGKFSEGVDGAVTSQTICNSSDTGASNVGSQDYVVASAGTHAFAFTSTTGARYTVWLSWIYVPKLSPSAAEKSAIADGVVTRTEYLAGFNRYAGCMAAAGYAIGDVDQTAPVIQYPTSNAAVQSGADNRCYQTQFRAVDELWQTEDGGINTK
jgi:hypothetical protein